MRRSRTRLSTWRLHLAHSTSRSRSNRKSLRKRQRRSLRSRLKQRLGSCRSSYQQHRCCHLIHRASFSRNQILRSEARIRSTLRCRSRHQTISCQTCCQQTTHPSRMRKLRFQACWVKPCLRHPSSRSSPRSAASSCHRPRLRLRKGLPRRSLAHQLCLHLLQPSQRHQFRQVRPKPRLSQSPSQERRLTQGQRQRQRFRLLLR
mmetsp:Transcript_45153/g.98173  ORF Transcript_45153/g.98173 Transcript_45153/m.98173 type:complete len:204 (+) Transcript_45153:906-1517(+)